MQVGLGGRNRSGEAGAVDLQILHDALDVVARFGKRDALDPVNRVDLGIARIAVLCHPLPDPPAAGIFGTHARMQCVHNRRRIGLVESVMRRQIQIYCAHQIIRAD